MIAAGCDKGSRQFIDGVGINAYFGSVNPLDIRRCEYVEWRAFSADSSSIEHDHPIAVLGSKVQIMQSDNDGQTLLPAQALDQIENLDLMVYIQIGGGLVKEHCLWLLG
jgi:hypothetical protein